MQYDFPATREISGTSVYWFDDSGVGQCRVPKSWRLLYQESGAWKPVPDAIAEPVTKDKWNRLKFNSIKTTALRLEAELQPEFSAGILEWRVE